MTTMLTDIQNEAISFYFALDRVRQAAKGGNCFLRHPLDGDCREAYAKVVAAFGGDQSAANAALRPQTKGAIAKREVPAERAPRAPRATRAATVRDPRIPPVGTTIEKRDRHGVVLATAIVLEDGIEYDGVRYGSPSAAGLAASRALGLGQKAVDGYTFWGLNRKEAVL